MPASRDQQLVHDILTHVRDGLLTVRHADGTETAYGKEGELSARMVILDDKFYGSILRHGSMGLGEAYMDGYFTVDDGRLMEFLGIMLKNIKPVSKAVGSSVSLTARSVWRSVRNRPTSLESSRRNVAEHYDGTPMYKRFLGRTMAYTCGYQVKPDDGLDTMQDQKHELICRKLRLKEGETIVDAGCGFGGMLLYAAKHHGIRGIGVTLSKDQQAFAQQRIKEEGLSDRIEVRLQDYRHLEGEFDKFVSIGMVEHVGSKNYQALMHHVHRLLKPEGLGLIHTIGSDADLSVGPDPWTERYIFPGYRLARLHELTGTLNKAGFLVAHVQNLKPHYAVTLRHWDDNFTANEAAVLALGKPYDERFLRMWHYYLLGAEAGFRYGALQLYQVLFCKRDAWRFPMVTEYGVGTTEP